MTVGYPPGYVPQAPQQQQQQQQTMQYPGQPAPQQPQDGVIHFETDVMTERQLKEALRGDFHAPGQYVVQVMQVSRTAAEGTRAGGTNVLWQVIQAPAVDPAKGYTAPQQIRHRFRCWNLSQIPEGEWQHDRQGREHTDKMRWVESCGVKTIVLPDGNVDTYNMEQQCIGAQHFLTVSHSTSKNGEPTQYIGRFQALTVSGAQAMQAPAPMGGPTMQPGGPMGAAYPAAGYPQPLAAPPQNPQFSPQPPPAMVPAPGTWPPRQ